MEAKRGRRVAIIEPESRQAVAEIMRPLSQVEWAAHLEKGVLSEKGMEKVGELLAHPREPTEALRRVLAKKRR
jgi:hypothetical protein